MAPHRPAPLSDELFAAPVLLGHTQVGRVPVQVKNTFVDMPSGYTPVSTRQCQGHPLQSAPANLVGRLNWPGLFDESSPATPEEQAAPQELETEPLDVTPVKAGSADALADASPAETFVALDDDEDDEAEAEVEQGVPAMAACAPRPPPGALHPSIGSTGHAAGTCKRCCFFPRGRCLNGYTCAFCHYEHEQRKRKSRTKKAVAGAPPQRSLGVGRSMPLQGHPQSGVTLSYAGPNDNHMGGHAAYASPPMVMQICPPYTQSVVMYPQVLAPQFATMPMVDQQPRSVIRLTPAMAGAQWAGQHSAM